MTIKMIVQSIIYIYYTKQRRIARSYLNGRGGLSFKQYIQKMTTLIIIMVSIAPMTNCGGQPITGSWGSYHSDGGTCFATTTRPRNLHHHSKLSKPSYPLWPGLYRTDAGVSPTMVLVRATLPVQDQPHGNANLPRNRPNVVANRDAGTRRQKPDATVAKATDGCAPTKLPSPAMSGTRLWETVTGEKTIALEYRTCGPKTSESSDRWRWLRIYDSYCSSTLSPHDRSAAKPVT